MQLGAPPLADARRFVPELPVTIDDGDGSAVQFHDALPDSATLIVGAGVIGISTARSSPNAVCRHWSARLSAWPANNRVAIGAGFEQAATQRNEDAIEHQYVAGLAVETGEDRPRVGSDAGSVMKLNRRLNRRLDCINAYQLDTRSRQAPCRRADQQSWLWRRALHADDGQNCSSCACARAGVEAGAVG